MKLNGDRRVSQENDIESSLAPTVYRKIRFGDHIQVCTPKNWRLTITLDFLGFVKEYEYEKTSLQFYLFISVATAFSNPFILLIVMRRDKLERSRNNQRKVQARDATSDGKEK